MRMQVRNPWRTAAVTAWLLTIVLGTAAPARAGVPSDQLRMQVDRVVRVLDDTELRRTAGPAERRAAIRRIANETFDFTEMSRRVLGPHWQARTPVERDEFTGLFADLLEHSFIGKMELYSGEKVAYQGDTIDGDFATVRTKVLTKQATEVPVVYRMVRRDHHWLVYDVSIEGVSLVANYRAQFNEIVQTSGYASLVQRLREKQIAGDTVPAKIMSDTR